MKPFLCALVLSLFVIACGGESPTAPSTQTPNVAGSYTGALDFTRNGQSVASGTAAMTVVQAGSQLTITGSFTVSGATFQFPAVTGTVNHTGYFTLVNGGLIDDVEIPGCGATTSASASLTFSGTIARYVESVVTRLCGTVQVLGTLRR